MSSDSDEDIGLRLQKMTNKYHGDKIQSTALLNDSNEIDEIFQNYDRKERESSPLDLDDLPGPSMSITPDKLLEIELINRPKRVTRSSGRKRTSNTNLAVELPKKRTKKSTSAAAESNEVASESTDDSNTTVSNRGRGRGRGRVRGRGNKSQSNAQSSNNSTSNLANSLAGTNTLPSTVASNALPNNMPSPAPELNTCSRSRGRRSRGRRSRGRRNRGQWGWFPASPRGRNDLFAMMQALAGAAAAAPSYDSHTYVIGDAEEVSDKSRGQALFSNQKKTEEVVDLEENENDDSMDDNEELSVKVHWQNYKYEIFKIRQYQKLTQIFDYFAQKENVGYDKLLFLYNDKIIKPTDTPDSINYNIAKKIEGGTLETSVAPITNVEEEVKDGIKIKFQCQHLKKPFEIAVRPDDKLSLSMTKCAEHLEKPLSVLRFEFDGDIITGKSTARELELEGGECIDVKVAS